MNVVPPTSPGNSGAWLRTAIAQRDGAVLVHVAADVEDLPRLASVITATERCNAFEQVVLDVGAGSTVEATLAQLGATVPVLRLAGQVEVPENVHGALVECRATALVVHVDDYAGLCCALAAARLGISIVRVGGVPTSGPGRVVARLADLLLTRSPLDAVQQPGTLSPERVCVIGNPLVDVVQRHARPALAAAAWRRCEVAPGAYVLAVLAGIVPFSEIEPTLRGLENRGPLLIEGPPGFDVPGARTVSRLSFLDRLSLERAAMTIVTDSARVHEEAAVLGVPCQAVDRDARLSRPVDRAVPPAVTSWDDRAGERAADALMANFARVRLAAELV
jgi:hypothetical protein